VFENIYITVDLIAICPLLTVLQAKTMTYKYWDQELMSGPLLGKFDVLLRGCYLYKELPFLRVTFIDVEKSRRVIGDGWVEERDVMAKRTELLTAEMNCTSQPRLLTAYVTQPVSLSLSLSLSRRVSFY